MTLLLTVNTAGSLCWRRSMIWPANNIPVHCYQAWILGWLDFYFFSNFDMSTYVAYKHSYGPKIWLPNSLFLILAGMAFLQIQGGIECFCFYLQNCVAFYIRHKEKFENNQKWLKICLLSSEMLFLQPKNLFVSLFYNLHLFIIFLYYFVKKKT